MLSVTSTSTPSSSEDTTTSSTTPVSSTTSTPIATSDSSSTTRPIAFPTTTAPTAINTILSVVSTVSATASTSSDTSATGTAASAVDTAQSTTPTASSSSSNGLSTGAKAGIGVAAGVAALALLAGVMFLLMRTRKRDASQNNDRGYGAAATYDQPYRPEMEGIAKRSSKERSSMRPQQYRGYSMTPQELPDTMVERPMMLGDTQKRSNPKAQYSRFRGANEVRHGMG
ncbi:MAG: hypothetical protein M1828_007394 [Chrysothrix sp. TS-e1954]|nr:MAG: hypothetical protein M1828_007394 [Chrysothrix sp. TS-e1954]